MSLAPVRCRQKASAAEMLGLYYAKRREVLTVERGPMGHGEGLGQECGGFEALSLELKGWWAWLMRNKAMSLSPHQ